MLGWEFPPYKIGGLAVASYYLAKYLSKLGVKITFVIPFVPKNNRDTFLRLIKLFKEDDFEILDLGEELFFTSYQFFKTKEEIIYFLEQLIGEGNIDYSQKIENLAFLLYSFIQQKIVKYKDKVVELVKSKKVNFDIVHCHDWPTYPAGVAVKEITNKPLVLHVHSTELDRSGFNPDPFKYNIEKEAFEKADKILTVSNRVKEIVEKHYSIDSKKIDVVYNGIVLDYKKLIDEKEKKNVKVVLYLARITLHKGPDYLIKAAKLVIDWYKKHKPKEKVIFVFAGSGEMITQLINLALDLGIADHIFFTGHVKGEEVDKLYQLADLYVLPSVSEPFGITPLEALKNDCPVIISKQSGVAEVLKNALKVDFWDVEELANKIIAVLEHKALKETLVKHGKEELKEINWEKSAKKTLDNYLELLMRRKRRRIRKFLRFG
jgi:glycosyltransferase involved in cell wall biosynthesis